MSEALERYLLMIVNYTTLNCIKIKEHIYSLKPVLNWENRLFAKHTSDSSMNYNLFLK